ncbi:leucine-rich repeat domain-containing protein, partial [Lactococcus cremoris]|nr:leucine-rich repeat domain-containing protein [Lactococcus cremoris]
APISSNTESSTSNSPSSEATDNSASNSSSDLPTNQEKDLKTGENAPSTTVETNNEKSSQTGSTTESSKPDSALTNSSDESSSPESLTDKKTSSSSEIKTDQSVPTFDLEESEGSPTTNTSVINKITESRKDTEETIASAQSKVDSNKSTTVNSAKEVDKNQLVDENPLKESSPDKSAVSGKQLPVAPANNQESSDKAASPQNILHILPNLPKKNTINKVEPEDSNSYLTEQNPAQNLKEILPILKNSPIDSANIDQGIIKKILKSNKEVQKSQSQLSKDLPLALDSDKISNVKLIAKDKQNQNEDESWKTSPDFDRIAVEKSEMTLTTPDSSTQNSDISSKSDGDNLNQEGQFNIENRDKLFSEREEAGAIISDNHKLDHTDVLSKNNSKIKLFISLLIIIIGSAIGWFIIFFKKRKKDNN